MPVWIWTWKGQSVAFLNRKCWVPIELAILMHNCIMVITDQVVLVNTHIHLGMTSDQNFLLFRFCVLYNLALDLEDKINSVLKSTYVPAESFFSINLDLSLFTSKL